MSKRNKNEPQKEEVKVVSRVDPEAIDYDDENHLKLTAEKEASFDGSTDKRKNGNSNASPNFDSSKGKED